MRQFGGATGDTAGFFLQVCELSAAAGLLGWWFAGVKEIILIRHGGHSRQFGAAVYWRTDEPLCEQGRLQALWLQQQGLHVDALLVSPALRARQTAQLAFPAMPIR